MAIVELLPLSHYTFPLGASLIILFGWTCYRYCSPMQNLRYPPGPPERNILTGNLSDLPASYAWRTYLAWGKTYGDIIHYRVFNVHMVVLNSFEDITELLEKNSVLFSDRFEVPMISLMGWPEFSAAFMRYGPEWRTHRQLYRRIFKPEATSKYIPAQTRKVHDFVYNLLTSPEEFRSHYRTLAAAIIMSLVYAHDVGPKNDYFVDLAEEAISRLISSNFLSAAVFNAFPILRFIPSWFPGAGFKRYGLEGKKLAYTMRDVPMAAVQKQIKEGLAPNCIAADLLEECKTKEDLKLATAISGTSYVGGAETTVSSVGTFFYAMARYPEVQRKAQKVIDALIGDSGRLVTFQDKPALLYIEALCREVLRWRPIAPLAIPHASSSDYIYKGYYIPKGTLIIPNIWAIAHDPDRYSEPDTFNPDRFFCENGDLNDDKINYAFGFGRRICPGLDLSMVNLWLTFATVLQVYDIGPKLDSNSVEIPLNVEYGDGMVSHPLPFECSITPRSVEARQLILESVGKA